MPLMRIRINDKQRLILSICLLLCLGFVTTSLVNYYVAKAGIRETLVINELPLTSDNLYSEIQKNLVYPIIVSSMMANDTFVREWTLSGEAEESQMLEYLRNVKKRNKALTTFFVSERTRIYYQANGILKTVTKQEPRDAWYFRIRNMKVPYEINVDPDLANNDTLTIFVNYRVLDAGGRFIGAIGMGLTADTANQLINDYQKRYNRSIYFVDRQGTILLPGKGTPSAGTRIHTIDGLDKLADKILRTGSGSFQYSSEGREHLLEIRLIPDLNWYLFVEGFDDEADASIRKTLWINLGACVFITILILLASSLIINRYHIRLEDAVTVDRLTGLTNRYAANVLAPMAISEAQRNGTPLLALLIGVNALGEVNHSLGPLAGDRLLQELARILKGVVRGSDILCHLGDGVYLLVAKNCPMTQRDFMVKKIHHAIKVAYIHFRGERIKPTVSIGSAGHEEGETAAQMIVRADKNLIQAKKEAKDLALAAPEEQV